VLVLAGISDVLDGWAARRRSTAGQISEPHRGDWLDPFCDKVFVAGYHEGTHLSVVEGAVNGQVVALPGQHGQCRTHTPGVGPL